MSANQPVATLSSIVPPTGEEINGNGQAFSENNSGPTCCVTTAPKSVWALAS